MKRFVFVFASCFAVLGSISACAVEQDDESVGHSEEMLGSWVAAKAGRDCLQGDGLYCGGHGVKGAADALYECSGSQYRRVETCSKSGKVCAPKPDGQNDRCEAIVDGENGGLGIGGVAGSCAGRGLGARYCGRHLISFGDTNKLYECRADGNGYLVSVCNSGCESIDGPSDDFCRASSTSSDPFPRMTAARAVALDRLNLRTGPSTDDGVVTVIPAGASVNIGDVGNHMVTTNGYWPVYYGGAHGWAARAYLALEQ